MLQWPRSGDSMTAGDARTKLSVTDILHPVTPRVNKLVICNHGLVSPEDIKPGYQTSILCAKSFWILWPFGQAMHCSYILNSIRFQTKSSLVWKNDSKNVVTNFQTKSSLVWKLKMLSQISKPNPVWFGNFLCRICGGNKFQNKSSLVWKYYF